MSVSEDVDTLGYGILGFVARPTHAAMSAVSARRTYEPMDEISGLATR